MEIQSEKLYPYKIKSRGSSFDVLKHHIIEKTDGNNEKTGETEEVWQASSYHGSVNSAFKSIVREKICNDEKTYNIPEFVERLEEITSDVIDEKINI